MNAGTRRGKGHQLRGQGLTVKVTRREMEMMVVEEKESWCRLNLEIKSWAGQRVCTTVGKGCSHVMHSHA